MSFLSKAWKGVKKVVKGAAKSIKKIAKKVAYSVPGGKELWKLGGKIGTKVMGAISKIGPIGMIALSVLAPYAAPLWSAFGAAAGTAATAGSIWGHIGTAIYNGANWVGGTLSSMTSGISKGISTIVDKGVGGVFKGSLSEAGKQAIAGFTDAFTGKAGTAGINAGIDAATQSAFKQAAGKSVWDQTVSKILGEPTGATNIINRPGDQAYLESQPIIKGGDLNLQGTPIQASPVANPIDQLIAEGKTNASASTISKAKMLTEGTLNMSGGSLATELATSPSLLSQATKIGKKLLSSGSSNLEVPRPASITSVGQGQIFSDNGSARGGVGSGGGGFLSPQMLAAIQAQEQRMTRGFG